MATRNEQVAKPVIVAPVEQVKRTSQMRDQPTTASLKANAERAASKSKEDYTNARVVAKGGRMWDPEHGQWVEDHRTAVTNSDWLKRQVEAGKIKYME